MNLNLKKRREESTLFSSQGEQTLTKFAGGGRKIPINYVTRTFDSYQQLRGHAAGGTLYIINTASHPWQSMTFFMKNRTHFHISHL